MFQNDSTSKYYKEIPLADILQIVANRNTSHCNNNNHSGYTFELRTQNVVYFVGDDHDKAKTWEYSLRQALMPVTTENSDFSGNKHNATIKNGNHSYPTDENENQNADISQQYQIFIDEMLGAGQFGTVYGGVHRTSGREVAIKVIDKRRFPTKQEAQLKNEVSILQNISHPGVVHLEKMFENPERIFVVMEKLSGDMLEMILNSDQGRLTERVTKFLIYQVRSHCLVFIYFNLNLNYFSNPDSSCTTLFALAKHLSL